jgi:hypothetical protein
MKDARETKRDRAVGEQRQENHGRPSGDSRISLAMLETESVWRLVSIKKRLIAGRCRGLASKPSAIGSNWSSGGSWSPDLTSGLTS